VRPFLLNEREIAFLHSSKTSLDLMQNFNRSRCFPGTAARYRAGHACVFGSIITAVAPWVPRPHLFQSFGVLRHGHSSRAGATGASTEGLILALSVP
jgi:hypothetical protein